MNPLLLLLNLKPARSAGGLGDTCSTQSDCTVPNSECIVAVKKPTPDVAAYILFEAGISGAGFCSAKFVDVSTAACIETASSDTANVHCVPSADKTWNATHFCDLTSGECLAKPEAGQTCEGNRAMCGNKLFEDTDNSNAGVGDCFEVKEALMEDASVRHYAKLGSDPPSAEAKCYHSVLGTSAGPLSAPEEMCGPGFYNDGLGGDCVAEAVHVKGDSCNLFQGMATAACSGGGTISCVEVIENEFNVQFYDFAAIDLASADGTPAAYCMDTQANAGTHCDATKVYCATGGQSCDFDDPTGANGCKATPSAAPTTATTCTETGFECGPEAGDMNCFKATSVTGINSGDTHYTYAKADGTCAQKWADGDTCGTDVYCPDGDWCDTTEGVCKPTVVKNSPCHLSPDTSCKDDIVQLTCMYRTKLTNLSAEVEHYYELATGSVELPAGAVCVGGTALPNGDTSCALADSTAGECFCDPATEYNKNGTCAVYADFSNGQKCGAAKEKAGCSEGHFCMKVQTSTAQYFYIPYPSGLNSDTAADGLDPKDCGEACVCMNKATNGNTCSEVIACEAEDTCQSSSCAAMDLSASTDCSADGADACGIDPSLWECVKATEGTNATDGGAGNFTYTIASASGTSGAFCSAPWADGDECGAGVHCPASQYCRPSNDSGDGSGTMGCEHLPEAGGDCKALSGDLGGDGCDGQYWSLGCYDTWTRDDGERIVWTADESNNGVCMSSTAISNTTGCKSDGSSGRCDTTSYCEYASGEASAECKEWTAAIKGVSCESPIPIKTRCDASTACVLPTTEKTENTYAIIAADAGAPVGSLCMEPADNDDTAKLCDDTDYYCVDGESCDTTDASSPICGVAAPTDEPADTTSSYATIAPNPPDMPTRESSASATFGATVLTLILPYLIL